MEAAGLDFALMVFGRTGGAERAYADAPPAADGIRWAQEVAFVEHHHHDRIVVRGIFAGRYVDADDDEQFIGSRSVQGALGGAAAGALFGPTGLVAGFLGGGIAGSVAEEHAGPRLRSALFDEVRAEVPQGSSAVMLLAPAADVDAMISVLAPRGGRLVRHHLEPDGVELLKAAVAGSPSAAPPA